MTQTLFKEMAEYIVARENLPMTNGRKTAFTINPDRLAKEEIKIVEWYTYINENLNNILNSLAFYNYFEYAHLIHCKGHNNIRYKRLQQTKQTILCTLTGFILLYKVPTDDEIGWVLTANGHFYIWKDFTPGLKNFSQ